jgi:hypothetical protein
MGRSRNQPLFFKSIISLVIMLNMGKLTVVQPLKNSYSNSLRNAVCKISNHSKLNSLNHRKFCTWSLQSTAPGAENEKKVAKRKTSILSRTAKPKPAAPVSNEDSFIVDSNPNKKMNKADQDEMISEYEKSVSRIPTSIKAAKIKAEKEVLPTVKATIPSPFIETIPKKEINTNTEHTNEESELENSQLTTHVTNMAFNSLDVSENTKRAIAEVMKYQNMTQVQVQSIPEIIKGVDAFVKARTGTGKTLAFLIPAIEVLITEKSRFTKAVRSSVRAEGGGGSVNVAPMILVLSPTRELALQIAGEAKSLSTFHRFNVITLVGGTNIESDKRAINKDGGVDIVVATPGQYLFLIYSILYLFSSGSFRISMEIDFVTHGL